ncbi:MAG: cytochrome c biogenesis protein CcsA [Salibacteraceae bacterium]
MIRLHPVFKISAIVLVFYALIAGLLIEVPALDILNESIRNLFFHVTSWFAMVFLFILSFIFSIKHLNSGKEIDDLLARSFVQSGMIFGLAGLVTGMLWARYTWGAFWVPDPKLNGSAIALLAYLAYGVLRNSFADPMQRGKVSAVYNIFAFVMMLLFIFILPRMTDSLHPGNGGNPAFSGYDLDSTMRMVFYPAIIGWILLGLWITEINVRIDLLKEKLL